MIFVNRGKSFILVNVTLAALGTNIVKNNYRSNDTASTKMTLSKQQFRSCMIELSSKAIQYK